jgi:hypothetical protein
MADRDEEYMDMRPLKRGAMDILPPGDPVREALQREPDYLPCKEAVAKVQAYTRLILARQARR